MDGEISNLILVWGYIFISSCYCYATAKLVPEGPIRFFMFLPMPYFFFHLPLYFTTFSFSNPIAFFITWLSSFKLLLLAFGTGPLSTPSLSLIQFFFLFSLPINLQDPTSPKPYTTKADKSPKKTLNQHIVPNNEHRSPINTTYKLGLRPPSYYANHFVLLVVIINACDYKDKFPRDLFLFIMCMYVYVGLEVILGWAAILGQTILRARIDRPFDDPYLSTSFQDFWGRRWNRVSSNSLRSSIFYPTFNYTHQLLGRKWAAVLALMVTFSVSYAMHEVLFYYMGRAKFSWGPALYFLLHGLVIAIESAIKRKISVKWRLPQVISGPLIFGFAMWTFMRLVLPDLLVYNLDGKILGEYAYVKDLGRVGIKMGYNLIVHNLRPT